MYANQIWFDLRRFTTKNTSTFILHYIYTILYVFTTLTKLPLWKKLKPKPKAKLKLIPKRKWKQKQKKRN